MDRENAQHMNKEKSKTPHIIKNLILLLVVIVICIILLELFLKVTGMTPLSPRVHPYRISDPVLHHALRPGASALSRSAEWKVDVTINSFGLRDEEFPLRKPAGEFRILMLGDSYTEGVFTELENTVSEQLEQMLNERTQDGRQEAAQDGNRDRMSFQVINAGVSSYSPVLEYLYLREQGLAFSPDVVVLNFDITDVQNDQEYLGLAEFDDDGTEIRAVPNPDPDFSASASVKNPVLDVLRHHSHIYQFLAYNLQFLAWKNRVGNISIDYLAVARDNNQSYDEEWQLTFEYVLRIKGIAEKNDAAFVLVIYPWPHQVSADVWKTRSSYFLENRVYSEQPFEVIRNFAAENDIILVDAVLAFKQQQQQPEQLYWQRDFHMTPLGLRLLAEEIKENLINQGLVPQAK